MPKLLVVDRNRIYAKRIKETLEHLAPSVSVDTASNVFETRNRLRNRGPYTLILADLHLAIDPSELQDVLDSVDTPKLIWSVVGGEARSNLRNLAGQLSGKPINNEDLVSVLNNEVLSVVAGA